MCEELREGLAGYQLPLREVFLNVAKKLTTKVSSILGVREVPP